MQISKDKMVTFEFKVSDEEGTVLDSSEEFGAYPYIHGIGHLIPGLESEMEGKSPGDSFSISVPPEKGYGAWDGSLVQMMPRDRFAGIEDLEVGMRLEAGYPDGSKVVMVTKVDEESVTLDANHPLSGMTLSFDITIADVRDATPEELEHGHSHDDAGCGGGCDCGCEDDC